MSANIKASVDGTQAIIGVGGVDQMTVSNAGVVTANSFVGLNNSSVTATGSTTARTLANRFADVVNVKDFGAVGDGVADDTAAFIAAVSSCKLNGIKKLLLGGLKYKLTQRISIDFSDFLIDGEGANIIWSGVGFDSLETGVFQFIGTLSSITTTISTNSLEYTSNVIVSNASGFSIGDIIQIDSASITPPGLYVNVTTRISGISGTTFSTDVTRRLALTSSETVSVTKLNAVQRSGIENCNFTAIGQTSRSNGMGGVFFQYTSNCFVKNCSFAGFWFKGVKAQFSLNMLSSNIYCSNPAATNDGEGYAVQYEYSYNSIIEKITAVKCRHAIDLTASWHIYVSDCFDSNSQSASYTLHSAFEYDIVFDKCLSETSSNDGAFVLGLVNTGFGDTTDQITVSNCSVVNCAAPQAISFRSKGQGLRISNTLIQMRPSIPAAAIAVGNANVIIDNCQLFGGIKTESDLSNNAFNSGDILVNNSVLIAQDSQRSLNILDGYRIRLNNCSIDGLVQTGNSFLYADNCRFVIQSIGNQFINFTGTTSNTGSYYFNNCRFDPSVSISSSRDFFGTLNSFIGCNFGEDPNNQPFNFQANEVLFVSNTGKIRFQILSTVAKCVFSNNNLNGVASGTGRIFNAIGFTGKLISANNILEQANSATDCFVITSSNLIEACVFSNNFIKGVVTLTDAQITNANVTGNIVDGTATYPTAGSQKIVTNNIVY